MLDVTVRKESANESVNRAERRGDYWNFGGIYRPVYLEVLPASFVDRVAIDARADGTLRADVFVGGASVPGRTLTARVEDSAGGAVGPLLKARLEPAAAVATLEGALPGDRRVDGGDAAPVLAPGVARRRRPAGGTT